MGFPYPLGHHHVYELAGHQLQSAAASVPFSIDGLLSGSCAASVVNPAPLIPSGCGVSGDSQPFKLAGRSGSVSRVSPRPPNRDPAVAPRPERVSAEEEKHRTPVAPLASSTNFGVSLGGGWAAVLAPRGGGRPRSERRELSPFPPAQGHACALNNSGPGPVPSHKVHRVAARIIP